MRGAEVKPGLVRSRAVHEPAEQGEQRAGAKSPVPVREASSPSRVRVGRRGTEPRNRQREPLLDPAVETRESKSVQQMGKLSFGEGRFCSKSHQVSVGPAWCRAAPFPVLFTHPTFV